MSNLSGPFLALITHNVENPFSILHVSWTNLLPVPNVFQRAFYNDIIMPRNPLLGDGLGIWPLVPLKGLLRERCVLSTRTRALPQLPLNWREMQRAGRAPFTRKLNAVSCPSEPVSESAAVTGLGVTKACGFHERRRGGALVCRSRAGSWDHGREEPPRRARAAGRPCNAERSLRTFGSVCRHGAASVTVLERRPREHVNDGSGAGSVFMRNDPRERS